MGKPPKYKNPPPVFEEHYQTAEEESDDELATNRFPTVSALSSQFDLPPQTPSSQSTQRFAVEINPKRRTQRSQPQPPSRQAPQHDSSMQIDNSNQFAALQSDFGPSDGEDEPFETAPTLAPLSQKRHRSPEPSHSEEEMPEQRRPRTPLPGLLASKHRTLPGDHVPPHPPNRRQNNLYPSYYTPKRYYNAEFDANNFHPAPQQSRRRPQPHSHDISSLLQLNQQLMAVITTLTRQNEDLQHEMAALRQAVASLSSTTQSKHVVPPPTPAFRSYSQVAASTTPPQTNTRLPAVHKPPKTLVRPVSASQPAATTCPVATAASTQPTLRQRQLIVRPASPIAGITGLQIRNAVNNALAAANAPEGLLVRTVTINEKGNAILTLVDGFSSEDLLRLKDKVQKAMHSLKVQVDTIEPDSKWFKILVHGVPVPDFRDSVGLLALKEEIERFNPGIKLAAVPRWVKREEKMAGQAASSVVIAVRTQEEQQIAQKGLWVNGLRKRTSPFASARPYDQCTQCYRFGHPSLRCTQPARCKYCAGTHRTHDHHCGECGAKGRQCSHTSLKCCNCDGQHLATSIDCNTVKEMHKVRLAARQPTDTAMDESTN